MAREPSLTMKKAQWRCSSATSGCTTSGGGRSRRKEAKGFASRESAASLAKKRSTSKAHALQVSTQMMKCVYSDPTKGM